MMKRLVAYLIATSLLGLMLDAAATEVYRTKDADGNVIFTDTPDAGAEKIELKETTVVPVQKSTVRFKSSDRTVKLSPEDQGYRSVKISSPAHEETLRNSGGVTVSATIQPALKVAQGHLVQFYYDGVAYGTAITGTAIQLTEVERGEHRVAAAVVDGSGKELARSDDSTFFMHRQSIQNPNAVQPRAR